MRFNLFGTHFSNTTHHVTQQAKNGTGIEACVDSENCMKTRRRAELPVAYSGSQGVAMYSAYFAARNTVR